MAKKPDGEIDKDTNGDEIQVGNILGSNVAIGRGAKVIVQQIVRLPPGIPNMAPPLPDKLVIREAELADLRRIILDEPVTKMTALRGMGGIGKTTLAILLCHEQAMIDAFPDGILWATLGPEGNVASAQQAWAEVLGRGEELKSVLELDHRATLLRTWLHDKTCLIVIDDVWQAEHLADMQIGGEKCAVLVTTRHGTVAREAGHAHNLGSLSHKNALALLAEWAGNIAVIDAADAEMVTKRLGYLPLALKLAGAQIAEGMTWPELLADYEKEGIALLDEDVEAGLERAFKLSLDRLNDEVRNRFALLAVFAAGREAPFTTGATAAVWDVDDKVARKTLRRLGRAGLVEQVEAIEGGHTLHLLLADYARGLLEPNTRTAAQTRHANYYYGVAERSEEEWQSAESALPQLREAWSRVARDDVDGLYRWAEATRTFFVRRGNWIDKTAWLETLLTAARAAGDRAREGYALHELGFVSHSLGRPDIALDHFRQSLAIRREVGDKANEAAMLNNIGFMHDTRGELDAALEHYRQSLDIYREIGDWAGEAVTLNNIGRIHETRGELDAALDHLRQTLAIDRELDDRAGEAQTLNNIGEIHRQRRETDAAFDYYGQSLAIRREVGDKAGEATTLNNIGLIHATRGELDAALDHYGQSLTIRREVGDKVGEAETSFNIASVLRQQGNLPEAVRLLEFTMDIVAQTGQADLAQRAPAEFEAVRAELAARNADALE